MLYYLATLLKIKQGCDFSVFIHIFVFSGHKSDPCELRKSEEKMVGRWGVGYCMMIEIVIGPK